MNSYSTSWWSLLRINRPREDERLSWPCWLTDSGRLTNKVIIRPASSQAQDRESSLVKDQRSTTVLRHQLCSVLIRCIKWHLLTYSLTWNNGFRQLVGHATSMGHVHPSIWTAIEAIYSRIRQWRPPPYTKYYSTRVCPWTTTSVRRDRLTAISQHFRDGKVSMTDFLQSLPRTLRLCWTIMDIFGW